MTEHVSDLCLEVGTGDDGQRFACTLIADHEQYWPTHQAMTEDADRPVLQWHKWHPLEATYLAPVPRRERGDLLRARAFAARWLAETESAEPPVCWPATDANLAQMFAGCVKPPRPYLYPLVRELLADRSWLRTDQEVAG